MRPTSTRSWPNAGDVQSFQNLAGEYRSLPLVGGALDVDLTGHVVTYAEKAIFAYLGKEEAAIRTNPAARTTSLLKSVFGK